MELEIAFIRQGQADASRLVGVTDMPLDNDARRVIEEKRDRGEYPAVSLVYSSGLSRCLKTAEIIYKNVPVIVLKELRAADYGDFDGMSRKELAKNEGFEKWASSTMTGASPNGEEPYMLTARSVTAFRKICDETAAKGLERVAVVTHKTVIQAVLQRYLLPRSSYAEWEIAAGEGCILQYNTVLATGKIISRF